MTTQINAGSKHYSYQPVTQDPQHKLIKAIEANRRETAAQWILELDMSYSYHGADVCRYCSAAVSATLNIDQANIAGRAEDHYNTGQP